MPPGNPRAIVGRRRGPCRRLQLVVDIGVANELRALAFLRDTTMTEIAEAAMKRGLAAMRAEGEDE